MSIKYTWIIYDNKRIRLVTKRILNTFSYSELINYPSCYIRFDLRYLNKSRKSLYQFHSSFPQDISSWFIAWVSMRCDHIILIQPSKKTLFQLCIAGQFIGIPQTQYYLRHPSYRHRLLRDWLCKSIRCVGMFLFLYNALLYIFWVFTCVRYDIKHVLRRCKPTSRYANFPKWLYSKEYMTNNSHT